MKKLSKIILTFILFLCVIFGCPNDDIIQASTAMSPYTLTTGTEGDATKANVYSIKTDGSELYRLDIDHTGCLEISMFAQTAGYITVEVHKEADGSDLPTYIAFPCTADRNNQYTVRQYIKKGTYYLKFPQNSYQLQLKLYSSETRSIRNGSTLAAYCDADIIDTFTYKAAKTGYITLYQKRLVETAAPMSVSFCNSNGKKLTDVISDHDIANKIVFPVKKGNSYKINIKTLNSDGQQYYQLQLKFTSCTEKSGSSKTKAASAKLKQHINGMVYAEDSTKQEDWYKISNTKDQKLKLDYAGDATSGSINLTIYNSKGKKLGTYYLMPRKSESITYYLRNVNKSSIIPKGTYYFKVKKSRKETAGVYEINIHP